MSANMTVSVIAKDLIEADNIIYDMILGINENEEHRNSKRSALRCRWYVLISTSNQILDISVAHPRNVETGGDVRGVDTRF